MAKKSKSADGHPVDTLEQQIAQTAPISEPTTRALTHRAKAAATKADQAEIAVKTRGKRGQPTKFTPELWQEVLDHIACCENIIDICVRDDMPSYQTIRRWYQADPDLKRQMEEAWADAAYLLHYANDSMLSGGEMSTGDFRRDEARAANNRWFMGKANRRLFGDKVQVDHTVANVFVMEQGIIDMDEE